MADSESVAASSEDTTLPYTLEPVARVLNRSVFLYCLRYEQQLDARRFGGCYRTAGVRQ